MGFNADKELRDYIWKHMGSSHPPDGQMLKLILDLALLRRELKESWGEGRPQQHLESIIDQLLIKAGRFMRFGMEDKL